MFLSDHRDSGHDWPKFQTPVLGDYGLAVRTNDDDSFNPRFYRDAGTPGFFAPEQREQVDLHNMNTVDDFRLSEKTNVFGIGLILWCMLMSRDAPPVPSWVGEPDVDPTYDIPDPHNIWSEPLKNLIHVCLQYDPEDRPDATGFLGYVMNFVTGPRDIANGMRTREPGPGVVFPRMPNEKYTIGFMRED